MGLVSFGRPALQREGGLVTQPIRNRGTNVKANQKRISATVAFVA